MDLPTALAISCDTYFYELGNRFFKLPPSAGHPLQAWAASFGFGRRTGSTSGPRRPGCCRRPSGGKRTSRPRPSRYWRSTSLWKPGDSIQLAIGQKDLLVTPLQMARFYALIANGGKLVTPHIAAGCPAGQQQARLAGADHPPFHAPARATGRPRPDLPRRRPGRPRQATHEGYGTSSAVFGTSR